MHIVGLASAAGTDGDLLQLAVNCTDHWIASQAASAASCISARLEAGMACRLLLTAAMRQHAEALYRLAQMKVFEQGLDAPTLEKLLRRVSHWPGGCATDPAASYRNDALRMLFRLPGAAQLISRMIAATMQAVEEGNLKSDFYCCCTT
jgi:hypothetical protein